MQRTPLFSFEEKDHQSYSYIFSLKFNFNQNNFYSRSQAKYFESAHLIYQDGIETDGRKCKYSRTQRGSLERSTIQHLHCQFNFN